MRGVRTRTGIHNRACSTALRDCGVQVEERKLCESLNGLAAQLTAQAAELAGSDGAAAAASPRRRTASVKQKASNAVAGPSGHKHDDGAAQSAAGDGESTPPGSPGGQTDCSECLCSEMLYFLANALFPNKMARIRL